MQFHDEIHTEFTKDRDLLFDSLLFNKQGKNKNLMVTDKNCQINFVISRGLINRDNKE